MQAGPATVGGSKTAGRAERVGRRLLTNEKNENIISNVSFAMSFG